MMKMIRKGGENRVVTMGTKTRSESRIEGATLTVDDVDDMSSWEFINPSADDDDDEAHYSYDEADLDDDYVAQDPNLIGSTSFDISMQSLSGQLHHHHHNLHAHVHDDVFAREKFDDGEDGYCGHDGGDEDDDDDGDDDDAGDYDLDDELVPRSVSDRFGKQRMRKLGKRAYSKMNKSKRVPCYYFNRPG